MGRVRREKEELEKMAYIDELTGVPNNVAFHHRMLDIDKRMREAYLPFAVIMVDVNRLKRVNDEFGHAKGDEAICAVSRTLCQLFTLDNVYRCGDEFVVCLEGDAYHQRRQGFQQLMAYAVKRDFSQEQPWQQVSLVAGMASSWPGDTFIQVLKRADQHMYEVKERIRH